MSCIYLAFIQSRPSSSCVNAHGCMLALSKQQKSDTKHSEVIEKFFRLIISSQQSCSSLEQEMGSPWEYRADKYILFWTTFLIYHPSLSFLELYGHQPPFPILTLYFQHEIQINTKRSLQLNRTKGLSLKARKEKKDGIITFFLSPYQQQHRIRLYQVSS